MVGILDELQVKNILASQVVGRLGCCDGNMPYIVPITYTYDGEYIYGQTTEGAKLTMLRKNPNVCFEIDMMIDMQNWQSIIITGNFEELDGDKADVARKILFNRIYTLAASNTVHLHEHENVTSLDDHTRFKPIMYRIKILNMSGRFEKQG